LSLHCINTNNFYILQLKFLIKLALILGWLHTGDLGYYDDDGEIFLVDRISEFINYRAIKISPAEIEALIQQHPAVLEVAVVAVPHEIDEQHAMAFVVKVSGKEVTFNFSVLNRK